MGYKEEIIKQINRLYFDSIEEFREAEARIANDSKFRRIFGKKNYSANIDLLKECKKTANDIRFPVDEIPEEDVDSQEIVKMGMEGIRVFNKLCDSYISLQMTLKKKSEGEDVSYLDFRKSYNETIKKHNEMNEAIRELDLLYAEYTEEEELPDGEYLTYDMIRGSDEEK